MIELISMFCDDCGKLRIIVIAFLTIDGLVCEKFLDILRVFKELSYVTNVDKNGNIDNLWCKDPC